MYLKQKKNEKVASPSKCCLHKKGDENCIFKFTKWVPLAHPVMDTDGIHFLNTIQWKCETHDKTVNLSGNTCKLAENTQFSMESHKIGEYRITQNFLDIVSEQHQNQLDFNIHKTMEFVYNYYVKV